MSKFGVAPIECGYDNPNCVGGSGWGGGYSWNNFPFSLFPPIFTPYNGGNGSGSNGGNTNSNTGNIIMSVGNTIQCPVDEHPMTLLSGPHAGAQDCYPDILCPSGQHPILNAQNVQSCGNDPILSPQPAPLFVANPLSGIGDFIRANPVIALGGVALVAYLLFKK